MTNKIKIKNKKVSSAASKQFGTLEADGRRPSQGIGIFRAVWNRILHSIARFFPLFPSMRITLHRLRGVKIGKNVFLGTEVFIDDSRPHLIEIEDNVTIIAGTMLLSHATYPRHHKKLLTNTQDGLLIKKGAYIGARALLLPGITVGENAIIAAATVVTKDVPPNTIVAGVPARIKKKFTKEDLLLDD